MVYILSQILSMYFLNKHFQKNFFSFTPPKDKKENSIFVAFLPLQQQFYLVYALRLSYI